MSNNKKDYVHRIIKTFIEAVISAMLVQLACGVDLKDKGALVTFLTGVLSAGLTAVFNIKKIAEVEE